MPTPTNQVEIWSDLFQDLIADGQGNLKKVINVESVRTSIDNILRTYQGERVFLPTFASNLRNLLFEPVSDAMVRDMSNNIKETIEIWDNRVSVTGVDIQIAPDNSYVQATLRFQILSYTEIFSQTVTLTQ